MCSLHLLLCSAGPPWLQQQPANTETSTGPSIRTGQVPSSCCVLVRHAHTGLPGHTGRAPEAGPLHLLFSPAPSDSPAPHFCSNVIFSGTLFKRAFLVLSILVNCFPPRLFPPNYYIIYVKYFIYALSSPKTMEVPCKQEFLFGWFWSVLPTAVS